MKIYIRSNEKTKIKIWIPLSYLKYKFILKKIDKHIGLDNHYLLDNGPNLYKILKKYIKTNGHFTLLEVKSVGGDEVKIII